MASRVDTSPVIDLPSKRVMSFCAYVDISFGSPGNCNLKEWHVLPLATSFMFRLAKMKCFNLKQGSLISLPLTSLTVGPNL